MKDKSIHLRVPTLLYQESEEIKKDFGFSNIQEFIKDAMRKTILEYKRQKALKNLEKNFGSVKNIKRLTREEREKLALELTPEEGEKLSKKYGLEKVRIK
ncbi:MAG: hypothetical protein AABX29_08275 [Nanoarchaeota archaeon]